MKILSHDIVFSGADKPAFSSCSFPSICELSDGTLIASFKCGEKKGPFNVGQFGAVCKSYDGGKTWTDAVNFFKAPIVDGKETTIRLIYFAEVEKNHVICVINAIDGTIPELPYYNEETEGLKDTYIMISHSYDNGETWSELKRIQVGTFYDLPLPLTGAPFVTKNGRVGIQFEVNKPYYEKEYWVHHSAVVFSEDFGHTWGNEVVITDCPEIYYWDQRIGVLDDGRLFDLFWTFDRNKGDYINIHSSQSTDEGRSFSPLIDTGMRGQPGNAVSGKDGKIVCIYINRDAAPIIKLAESSDGKTWKDVLTVFDFGKNTKGKKNGGMNDVWSEMGAFSVGHPFLKKLKDGTLLAYFYSGPSTHRTDFHVVRIEM